MITIDLFLFTGNNTSQLRRNDSILSSTNRIQNDTTSCRLTPQNSIKRHSISSRRSSCVFNNNAQLYQKIQRQNSLKNHARRMSSIEQAYMADQKSPSHKLNTYNFDHTSLNAFQTSKLDLDKLDNKSQSNANVSTPDTTSQHEHRVSKIKQLLKRLKPEKFTAEREDFSLYIFPHTNK